MRDRFRIVPSAARWGLCDRWIRLFPLHFRVVFVYQMSRSAWTEKSACDAAERLIPGLNMNTPYKLPPTYGGMLVSYHVPGILS